MTNDDKFMDHIKALGNEKAPDDLYRRIMSVVPHLAQVSAAEPEKAGFFARFFTEWQYGLALKFASLAIIAGLGFCVGHLNGSSAHQESFFSAIITGDFGWED